jgi:hypothetical protein
VPKKRTPEQKRAFVKARLADDPWFVSTDVNIANKVSRNIYIFTAGSLKVALAQFCKPGENKMWFTCSAFTCTRGVGIFNSINASWAKTAYQGMLSCYYMSAALKVALDRDFEEYTGEWMLSLPYPVRSAIARARLSFERHYPNDGTYLRRWSVDVYPLGEILYPGWWEEEGNGVGSGSGASLEAGKSDIDGAEGKGGGLTSSAIFRSV